MSEKKSHGGHSHGGHSHGGHAHAADTHGHGVGVEEGFVPASRPQEAVALELPRGAGRGKILFLDLPSGIAGDMINGALVDLGVPFRVITEAVASLNVPGLRLSMQHGYAGAIGCFHFNVDWDHQEKERSYQDIVVLLQKSSLATEVRELSLKIFALLAKAEAAVHSTTLEHVHFHEVGSLDAIADIVGASAAFCYLEAEVKASPVPLGRGFVNCRHGMLPLPAPATLNCLKGVPTVPSGLKAELVTPTGAAILATVATGFGDWFSMTPQRVGFGAGTRGLPDRPNAMRAILGQQTVSVQETHVLLEANIDDMSAEVASYALEKCLISGAVDAWIVPATMKKGRPGMVFSALAASKDAEAVTLTILRETSTIGVRQTSVTRTELSREVRIVSTQWGDVRVKTSALGTPQEKNKPEVADCILIAERTGIALRVVLSEVARLANT